jgi:hypothetical protein
MKKLCIPILLFGFFYPYLSYSQSYFLPPLRFTLYGKDAKPISEKNDDYKVEIKNSETDSWKEWNNRYGDSLSFCLKAGRNHSEKISELKITYLNSDSMRIKMGCYLDSIKFQSGNYFIPLQYSCLFKFNKAPNVRIHPESLKDFKVDNFSSKPNVKVISCENIHFTTSDFGLGLNKQNIETYIYDLQIIPGSKIIMALVETGGGPKSLIMQSKDLGKSWQRINYPPGHKLKSFAFKDSLVGWVYGWDENDITFYGETKDGGNSWKKLDSKRDKLPPVDMNEKVYTNKLFLNKYDGFKIEPNEPFRNSLYKTSDGGASWEFILSDDNWDMVAVDFLNEKKGAILGKNCLFITGDLGKNWEYIPFTIYKYYNYCHDCNDDTTCRTPEFKNFYFLNENTLCVYGELGVVIVSLP